jgi:hypothetical protein
VEPRTRTEYYEALRAADEGSGQAEENRRQADTGSDRQADTEKDHPAETRTDHPAETRTDHQADTGTDDQADTGSDHQADIGTDHQADSGTDHQADSGTERSGWESVDAMDRPAPDAIHISPDRSTHILDGDKYGGGHRHGTGKPGKTEFPASWDDQKVVDTALDVARKPDQAPVLQDRNNRWLCVGTRDSVEVSVIVLPGGDVWTAWPEEGSPGVIRNPRKEAS